MSSRVKIDTELVNKLIAAQFPHWQSLPVKPVKINGLDNRMFHLGNEMIVRMPSAERYAAQVLKEQRWLKKLAPQLTLDIPTPVAMGTPGAGYKWHPFR